MRIFIVALLWLLCGGSLGSAQTNIVYLNELTPREGLSETTNSYIYKDSHGLVWISTMNGVNVFDGNSVRVHRSEAADPDAVKGNNVQSIFYEDSLSNIWFLTDAALNVWLRKENHFRHLTNFGQEDTPPVGLFGLDEDGYLWVSTEGKIYLQNTLPPYDNRCLPEAENFYAADCVLHTVPATGEKILYAALWIYEPYGAEVLHFNADNQLLRRERRFEHGNSAGLPQLTVYDVLTATDSSAWLRTDRPGLLEVTFLPEFSYQFYGTEMLKAAPLSAEQIFTLNREGEGRIFDTKSKQFAPRSSLFAGVAEKEILKGTDKIYATAEREIWFSHTDKGLYFGNRLARGFVNPFLRYGAEAATVQCIRQQPDGTVVYTNDTGMHRTFGEKNTATAEVGLPFCHKVLYAADGDYHAVSDFDFYRNEKSLLRENKEYKAFYDLARWNDDLLLVACNRGVAVWSRSEEKVVREISDHLAAKVFVDSRRRIWINNGDLTISLWEGNPASEEDLRLIRTFTDCGIVNHLTEDSKNGILYAATSYGLVKICLDNLERTLFQEKDGLPAEYLYAAAQDRAGDLWLSSNKGIVHYRPAAAAADCCRLYTERDGLSARDYAPGAVLVRDDGEIIFGSTRGADRFYPQEIRDVGRAPRLGLYDLRVNNRPWEGEYGINHTAHLSLAPTENSLSFRLSAMEYTDPTRNRYEVYLKHNGKTDTTLLGTNPEFSLNYLAPGAYKLGFTAANAEGIWQQNPKYLEFYINPYYYQTWWFRTIAALGLMSLVGFVLTLYYRYRLREQQLEAEKKERIAERERVILQNRLLMETERARIAGEMHDEIGGGLSTIRYATAMAVRKKKLEEVLPVLTRLSQLSIGLITNMRSIIWAMDPENDSLEDLTGYIRRFTAEFLEDNGLEADIKIPRDLPDRELSGKFRHNIILVIKEALHNIAKSAQADRVEFKLEVNGGLLLHISDNGIGFDPATVERRGHGLRNMTKRIESLHGNIEWLPRPGGGTTVKFYVPWQPTD